MIFIGIYQLSKKIYPIEEHYQLTDKAIKITSKLKNKTEKTEIKYKDIKKFKTDKLFHGGRIETKKKNHPIYFNHKKEIHKFEKVLKKKVKS